MSNIDVVKNGQAIWCTGNVQAMAAVLTDDFAITGVGPMPLDKAAFLGLCQASYIAGPDFSFNATDFQENGNTVTCRARITFTHTGVLALIPGVPPVPPTNIRVEQPEEIHTFTVRDGKLAVLHTNALAINGGIPFAYATVGSPLPMPSH